MATASFSSAAEDDLSCPVCFNLFKDPNTPKELDCSHVFCAKCIHRLIEGGRRIVDCPECRHATRIPKKGVDAMKTVYRLRSLAEKHHEHTKKAAKRQDDSYQKVNENLDKRKDAESVCPEHNVVIDFFCKKCNAAGCSSCIMYSHHGPKHDVIGVETAHCQQLAEVTDMIDQMNTKIEECALSIQELATQEKHMIQWTNEQMDSIDKQLELAISHAKENARVLKEKYNSIEQPKIGRVREEKGRLEMQMASLKDMKSSVGNTVAFAKKCEYVELHVGIVQSVRCDIGKDCCKIAEDFHPVIGKARVGIEKLDFQLCSVLQVRPCLLREFGECDSLWTLSTAFVSVTDTADNMLLVSANNNTIYIFSRNKDKYKKETYISLSTKETDGNPVCIKTTTDGRILVVRDGTCIEIYSLSGRYGGVLKMKPTTDGMGTAICNRIRPSDLIVEEDGSLIVADYNGNIVRFSNDGMFRHSIATAVSPCRIAMMPNGKIAATNIMENLLFVCDLENGMNMLTVEVPQANAICYHKDTDTLLVGRCPKRKESGDIDGDSGVIEQYCPTSGALVRQVYKREDGFTCNHQYMIMTNDGMLASAENFSVRVYTVTVDVEVEEDSTVEEDDTVIIVKC